MKNWQVKIIDSCNDVSDETWTEIASGRSVFQQKYWFNAVPHPGKLTLIGAWFQNKLAVILPVFIVEKPGHYYHNPPDILEQHKENWYPCAVTVSPFGYRGGIICKHPEEIPSDVYDMIINEARLFFRTRNVRMAAFYYLNKNDDGIWMEALHSAGIGTHVVGADCNLELKWDSMDDFFQSLGAHRKSRVRAEFRKLSAGSQWKKRTKWEKNDVGVIDAVAELFASTQRKHHHETDGNWHRSFLQELSEDRFLLTVESEGNIRSALLVFRKGNVLCPKFYGDKNVKGDYFLLCYYLLIQEAIQSGVKRIEFGGGSHKAKLLRGASLRPLYMGIEVFDQKLAGMLESYLPLYEKAKKDYFSVIRDRYGVPAREYDLSYEF